MAHFSSACVSSPPNPQVIFYDVHVIHFGIRGINLIQSHHIQALILKSGDYVHDQTNNNNPQLSLNKLYGNAGMNWMNKNGTLKFTPAQIN